MKSTTYTFEIMTLVSTGGTTIKSDEHLSYSLMSNSEIWKSPELRGKNKIHDKDLGITLGINQTTQEHEDDHSIKNTFVIKLKGSFECVENIRIKLLRHLHLNGFDHTYILSDEISAKIAQDIYPNINVVENSLRKYILKFFITKLGPSWWNVTADSEMKKKVTLRKNNETLFSQYTDNRAYLIDFGELGKIVHSQSSGFISREDILNKVLDLDETSEAIKKLKTELESNYTKFFKDNFKSNNFQQKWEELEKLRHKVAHNNLFSIDDLRNAEVLCDGLLEILNKANDTLESVEFNLDEKDILKENIAISLDTYNVISENDLIKKLKESQDWALTTRDNFVGLKHFVVNHLGSIGYDYRSSYELINKLEQEGKIEIYDYKGESNLYPVKAIKSLSL
ncbi:hypothetical protein K2F45_11600 [Sphingobacterium siyangense]|uniref:HEPN domain-containing protein n=1 Tax=Sphingobacterium siyangense TaxID=459529 RepID=UPI00200E1AC3|nr:HEPN domain-containing protein [Sphingobacterium siyangense]UQA77581.1 hypothetical protein K2F45_11600 [Sphingobacterium siyangense]